MSITKNCIFLSDSNIELMTSLRMYSLRQGVELSPCRKVVEMLELYNKGTNAILVEKIQKFENLYKYISEQNFNNFFYLHNQKVFDSNNNLVYKNVENFFKSKIFKQKITNPKNAKDKITKKLSELGVVFNSWNSRCIKLILEQMAKENNRKITRNIMKMVSINSGNTLKTLYDNLRPTLKEYTIKLNNKTHQNNNTNKVRNMIDVLYNFCFN